MNKIRAFIPNMFTLGNLLCGIVGIYYCLTVDVVSWQAFWSESHDSLPTFTANAPWARLGMACIFILFSGLLDFFDGFVARWLKVSSPIGAELDSLADVVSFGVLPGFLMFQLMHQVTDNAFLLILSAFLPLCGAYRLAKFNVDPDQSETFKGLAIPSMALFIVGLCYQLTVNLEVNKQWFTPQILSVITLLFGWLMVSNIPMFSFKMKSFDWAHNWFRYVLIVISIPLLFQFKLGALALIIPTYILLSVVAKKQFANA